MIDDVAKDNVIDRVVDTFGARDPVVVAPSVIPEETNNALALSYAQWLGHELGLEVCETIFQSRGLRRNGKGAWYRLANPPVFYGQVPTGRDFIIADDVLTLGGTMAALRSFIEFRGGHVICMTVLAHRTGEHVPIALDAMTRLGLDKKHGPALGELWQEEFGHGPDCLTRPEGRLLLGCAGVDRIRKALHGARDRGHKR